MPTSPIHHPPTSTGVKTRSNNRLLELGRTLLAWLIAPFRREPLQRWAEIIAMSMAGAALAGCIVLATKSISQRLGEIVSEFSSQFIIGVLLVIYSVLLPPLIRLGAIRAGHWRSLVLYPPCWIASLGGAAILLVSGVQVGILGSSVRVDDLIITTCIWAGAPIVGLVYRRLTTPRRPVSKQIDNRRPDQMSQTGRDLQDLASDPPNLLIPWLEEEQPIRSPGEDLFGTREIARSIAVHLAGDNPTAVGLRGAYGAGKSSVIRMIEYYLVEDSQFKISMHQARRQAAERALLQNHFAPRILFCRVSVWGMVDGSGPTAVLSKAVERLSDEADCLSVITLPDRYVQAFRGAGANWYNLPLMLSSVDDPMEQLRRLGPILRAINAMLVIVVEDLDRNLDGTEEGSDKKVAREMQAMLDRLSDVEGITFVLSVSSASAVDLTRLCERIENLRPVERQYVLTLVDTFRDYCLTVAESVGCIQCAREESLLAFRPGSHRTTKTFFVYGPGTPESEIAELLANPRELKQSLRHVWSAWRELRGEVAFDELLVLTLVRFRSPRAFDFVLDKYMFLIRSDLSSEDKQSLSSEWSVAVTDCDAADQSRIWSILNYCFPNLDEEDAIPSRRNVTQSVRKRIYWDRIVSGRIEKDSVRDQEVLSDVASWKSNLSSSRLAFRLARESAFISTFERIYQDNLRDDLKLSDTDILRLASLIFEDASRPLEPNSARLDQEPSGFIVLWRMFPKTRSRHAVRADYLAWIRDEIQKAMRRSLGVALDIEYYWGSFKEPCFITPDEAFELRQWILDWAKEHLTQDLLPNILVDSFPYALYQFVIRGHIDVGPRFDASQWHWLIAILLPSLTADHPAVVRQACTLFSKEPARRGRDAEWTSEIGSNNGRLIDWNLLAELVPSKDDQIRILESFASMTKPENQPDQSVIRSIESVRTEALAYLDVNSGDSAE